MEAQPPIRKVAAIILSKQSRTANKGWSYSLGLGEMLTTPHRRNWSCYEKDTYASDLDCFFGTNYAMEKGTCDSVRGMLGACIEQVYVRHGQ
jgi:hypothetical protein